MKMKMKIKKEGLMTDVYLFGPHQDRAPVAQLANRLQSVYRFLESPTRDAVPVRLSASESHVLFRASREHGVSVSRSSPPSIVTPGAWGERGDGIVPGTSSAGVQPQGRVQLGVNVSRASPCRRAGRLR